MSRWHWAMYVLLLGVLLCIINRMAFLVYIIVVTSVVSIGAILVMDRRSSD